LRTLAKKERRRDIERKRDIVHIQTERFKSPHADEKRREKTRRRCKKRNVKKKEHQRKGQSGADEKVSITGIIN